MDGQVVGAKNLCDLLSKGAGLVVIDLVLIMFQAHSELCVTLSTTKSIAFQSFTAVAINVTCTKILKFFQPDLKHSLGP